MSSSQAARAFSFNLFSALLFFRVRRALLCDGAATDAVPHLRWRAWMVEKVAELSAALAAHKLRSCSAVGAERLLPHLISYMIPEAWEAAASVELLRRREKGAAANSAAIYNLRLAAGFRNLKFVPDAHSKPLRFGS